MISFENHFKINLPSVMIYQYQRGDDKSLEKLVLSKRAKKCEKICMCYISCKLSLVRNKSFKAPPPTIINCKRIRNW